MAWVLSVGNAFDGLQLIGPFEDTEVANRYAEREHDDEEWHVVELGEPDSLGMLQLDDVETCTACGETYAPGGDGYNGLCPSCADRNEIVERAKDAGLSGLTVTFQPQAWDGDTAVPVPPGLETWQVGLDEIDPKQSDNDYLQFSRNAPQWVRDWSGPFEIALDDPDDEPCPEYGSPG